MGKFDIKPPGSMDAHESDLLHQNTLNEYSNEVSEELLDHHLHQISSLYKESKGCVCYVVGMGAHPKSTYTKMEEEAGIEVIWSQSILPSPFKVLSIIIASHAGLIKVTEPEKLPCVFERLCDMSMAGVYIFDQSMEQSFIDSVVKHNMQNEVDFGIRCDDRYFFYIVDADNSGSSTGMFELVSYGKKATNFAPVF